MNKVRFKGKVWRDGKFWLAEVPEFDVMTQGFTKQEALEMIADVIEGYVNFPRFKVDIHEGSGKDFEIGSIDTECLNDLFLTRGKIK